MLTIPGYHLVEELHASPHSAVLRGQRESDQRPVVLKVLNKSYPTPVERARFQREYEMTRRLDSPWVVEALALDPYQHSLVMVLEDFGAVSLRTLLSQLPLSLDEKIQIALQIVEALIAIHDRGVMHKDLNPSNIVLNPDTRQLKLIDLGIATTLSRELSAVRHAELIEGTLAYLSPEQSGRMNRVLDYRTDFYSLGVTLYELLTGRLPFEAEDPLELLHAHLARPPRPPSELDPTIPTTLSDLLLKLLAKTAEARYQSGYGLRADLLEIRRQLQGAAVVPFALGEYDLSPHLLISQHLYGREREIECLLGAFDRVSKGATDFLLVSGVGGVGKTALVNELHKPLVERGGYFVSGKFDQLQRTTPYTALIQAFRELIRQILTESDAQVARWRARLLEALGSNGQVIIDVVPEVELLIGAQPTVPVLGPQESQNRFQLLFQDFVGVFARPEHPLILFLDDLHRADLPSLTLLKLFLTDPQQRSLLLLGAYRDSEVDEAHPLMALLAESRAAGVELTTLPLAPLSVEDVTTLIADTLRVGAEQAAPLAEVISAKTAGTPFFVGEFLKALYDEELLRFVPPRPGEERGGWRWELAQIQARDITDNVVELMQERLQELPAATQTHLMLAACIGNTFDLATLVRVKEQTPGEVALALHPALQAGLILPLGEGYRLMETISVESEKALAAVLSVSYRFQHDRVQQAAYALVSEAERPHVHLRIARLLLVHSRAEEREQRLFDLVDHFNQGLALLKDEPEREAVARLNLQAGQKAKAATAYEPAFRYLTTGLALLPPGSWQSHYELTLTLHLEAAESAYLKGDFARMEALAQTLLAQAHSLLDQVKMYEILILADIAQYRMREAIGRAQTILRQLGVSLPDTPTQPRTVLEFVRTRFLLRGKSMEALAALPEMRDPHALAAMRLLAMIPTPAIRVATNLVPFIVFNMVQLSVRHGNATGSAYGYALYGMILCQIGEVDQGYAFGQLAMTVAERLNDRAATIRVNAIYYLSLKIWKEHVRGSLAPLQSNYHQSLQGGDLEFAAANLVVYMGYLLIVSEPLPRVAEEITKYEAGVRRLRQPMLLYPYRIVAQTILNLLGRSQDPQRLVGEYFNEDEELELLRQTNDRNALVLVDQSKAALSYLFGAHAEAVLHTEDMEKDVAVALAGSFTMIDYRYMQSLALLAHYPEVSPSEQRRYLKKVATNQKELQKYARHCPMNLLQKFHLVEAERARLAGKHEAAVDHYQQAIARAKEQGYTQDEGMANELAARYYLARGMPQAAQGYLLDARQAYLTWGALAKVQQLEEEYPQLRSQVAGQVIPGAAQGTLTSTGQESTERLDLATVLKASQAISSEIDLDTVLTRLLQVVMENAGAQKGVLLLAQEGQLLVEAVGTVHPPEVTVMQAMAVEECPHLSTAIVHYVERTHQDVILDDARREGQFTSDPYVRREQPCSVLCTSLLNQGRLVGVLYLENNLSAGAFTPARVEIVRLLGTQAAISITNAQAIAARAERERLHLEKQLLEQRAQDLAELNASKDKFFSIISHDLRSPFNGLLGLSQLMRRYLDTLSPEETKTYADRIYESGKNVLALLDNLLYWSQMQTGRMKFEPGAVDLSEIARRTTTLLKDVAANKEIHLLNQVCDGEMVYADPYMLETVIRNLISNALKFTEASGQIRLETLLHDGMLQVAVADTGVGMSQETMQKLFRIDVTHTTKGTAQEQGTGLGLILCKEMVEKNGGTIWVESTLGQGTTFRFTVPRPLPD